MNISNNRSNLAFTSGYYSRTKFNEIPVRGNQPEFDSTGRLRPGIYEMSIPEIRQNQVLGSNQRRQELIANLEQAVTDYGSVGISDIYVGGSFASTKPTPGDIDGFVVFNGEQYKRLKESGINYSQPKTPQGKAEKPVDFVPCPISNADNTASFFTANNSRGIIKIK